MRKDILLLILVFLSSAVCMAENDNKTSADTIAKGMIHLSDIVVTGSRIPIAREVTPNPVSVVSRTTIEESGEVALLPVLSQQVPGLFVTTRGIAGFGTSGGAAGGINMRGFAGSAGRILILIDGHPQYATIYGHPVSDAYIASEAQQVEVSRGSASTLYGSNAMGGAINIITRKATEDGNSLRARLMGGSYGTQRYTLTDSYRKGKFSGVFSGNYERTDGHRVNSEYDSRSGYAKLSYILSDEWKLTGNVDVVKANSQNPGTESKPMIDGTAEVLRGMSGLSLENHYHNTSGAVNFYYNWGDHQINDGYSAGEQPQPYLFNSTDYMGGVNVYQAVNLFKGNTITGGFDAKLYGGNAYRNPETEYYADHIRLHEVAGYVFIQQEYKRFLFDAGIRLEDNKLYGTEWVPQAGISFRAADQTSLKLSASKGFRTPNLKELYMFMSANEDLLPESSISYDFTVSQRLLNNRLSMELCLYYIEGDNLVETVRVDGRPQNQNVGEFANKGVEISLNYRLLNNLHLNSNYSYLEMEKTIAGAPKNKFYAGLTYHPNRFTFRAGAQVIDQLTLTDKEDGPTSSYTLINARASYRMPKWAEFFVQGDNLLGQSYETMQGFPMPRATFMGGVTISL